MWSQTIFDEAKLEFFDLVRDLVGDLTHWFSRLSDLERLVGLAAFILMLFLLVVVKAGTREHKPAKSRNFVSSLVLVVVFGFFVVMLLETPFDPRNFLNEDVIRNIRNVV